jgi:hypothetical protein
MLTHLKNDEIERIQNVICVQPAFNVRVSALLKAYGCDQTFFNVWHQNFDTVLARLESSFFICEGENADFEELAFFLNFNPYFRRLSGKTDVVEKIAVHLTGKYECRYFDFLTWRAGKPYVCGQNVINASPSLRDVYSVMDKAKNDDFTVGDFTPWYTDISHRIRHGCARAYLLKSGGVPASSCLISAESGLAGILSGIATRPQFRGHGFAAAVLQRACHDLADCGKLPVLECLPSITRYYGKQEFEKFGDVEELNIF